MNNSYKGVVWTNHALQRLKERGISQSDAWYVFSRPDQSRYAQTKGAWIYYKNLDDQKIEVVAKKDEGKWIILSVWSSPSHKTQTAKEPWLNKIIKKIFK